MHTATPLSGLSPAVKSLSSPVAESSSAAAKIIAVGTANSANCYTQRELLDRFQIDDRRIRSVFLNGGIEKRFLALPERDPEGGPAHESQGELLEKHRREGIEMGKRALQRCLDSAGMDVSDMAYLCCVTTTGLLTPGLSALISHELDLPRACARLDVVGMGCNAGLNGLNAVRNWAEANPGRLGVMLCIEVCSAAYVFDGTIETAVVNSLFGDGSAAVAIVAGVPASPAPRILKFSSLLITEAIGAMRFNWDDAFGKFSFYLDRDVPYVVGAHAERVISSLLEGTGLRRNDISHWIVHSGGKKVIDAVRINLGLSKHDVRHTTTVLSNFGNLSSGSFLFSLKLLLEENLAYRGDYGVLMTMGPGSTIETALIQW
jgi:predicted naringenin-chalcone synthase